MKFLKNYSLSITLAILFLGSWIGQLVFQWEEYKSTAEYHNQDPMVSEFIPEFFSATFENWQSEFLQLFTMVVLTAFLIHKGSAESKDSNDRMEAALKRIENKLETKS